MKRGAWFSIFLLLLGATTSLPALCHGESDPLLEGIQGAIQESIQKKDRKLAAQLLSSLDFQAEQTREIINQKNRDGKSPLLLAIESGIGFDVLRSLLDRGADLNAVDQTGKTPLLLAAQKGQIELMRELLKRGAEIHHHDSFGWTPLTQSVVSTRTEQERFIALKLTLDHGAQPNVRFPSDPFAYASVKQFESFQGRSLFAWAVESNSIQLIRYLLKRGVELKPLDSIVMSAIQRGNLAVLKLAWNQGAQLCSDSSPSLSGHTPLTLASAEGKTEIVQFILDTVTDFSSGQIRQSQCDLNQRGKDGLTALGWAGQLHRPAIVRLLLDRAEAQFHGASDLRLTLQLAERKGWNPLIGTWIQYFAATQAAANLNEILSLKSRCETSFEGERVENENSEFMAQVRKLQDLMNQKTRDFYYLEREKEIQKHFRDSLNQTSSDLEQGQTHTSEADPYGCLSCTEKRKDPELSKSESSSGPAGCSCYLCPDCASVFCDMVVNRDGEGLSLCPGCNLLFDPEYLTRHGRSQDETKKVRARLVDRWNSQQLGWVFCPTSGCAGGRIVQPEEESPSFSCFLCGQNGCIRCGNGHKGSCSLYEEQMRGIEELLRLGAMIPPVVTPEDENHPDYLKGRFRPCYHCGVITERIDGCNRMTCGRCNKAWDWNEGPEGRDGNFSRGEMRYRPLKEPHF